MTDPPAGTQVIEVGTAVLDALEDLDDTQNVYHNADIPEEAME